MSSLLNEKKFNNELPRPFTNKSELYRFKSRINNNYSYLSNFFPDVSNYESNPEIKKLFDKKSEATASKPAYLFTIECKNFISSEQYYQYRKFMIVEPCYIPKIMDASNSIEVKQFSGKGYFVDYMYDLYIRLDRKRTKKSLKDMFDEGVQKFYSTQAIQAMRTALYAKFTQNPELKKALISTYPHPLSEIGRMKKDYWAHTGQDNLQVA